MTNGTIHPVTTAAVRWRKVAKVANGVKLAMLTNAQNEPKRRVVRIQSCRPKVEFGSPRSRAVLLTVVLGLFFRILMTWKLTSQPSRKHS